MPARAWRERLTGAFQDFFRFEFTAQHSVGLGDLPTSTTGPPCATRWLGPAPTTSSTAAGRPGQPARPDWPGGQELSFGQWQKLALARGYMRTEPLLMILDEPTAALDAETEHELFERYAERPAQHDGRRHHRSWCRTGSARCGSPI